LYAKIILVNINKMEAIKLKIVTLTLNPALDIHYTIESFVPFTENYANHISIQAGGKGVNISKSLKVLGKDCTSYIVIGKENAKRFEDLMNIPYKPLYAEGKVRENITIHSSTNPETRISLDDFYLSDGYLKDIENEILDICDEDTIITLTGRLPKGLSNDTVFDFCKNIKEKDAKLVIDSNSFSLDMLTEISPWLIKPNEEEIGKFFRQCHSLSEAEEIAKIIHSEGIENVMISMGKQGIAYAGNVGCFSVKAPKIDVISTVGAGDCSVSGFIYAYSENKDIKECIIHAVAFGSAACLTEGSNPPTREDFELLYKKTKDEETL
jgi:1-phosphofructokinase family hexose kinase